MGEREVGVVLAQLEGRGEAVQPCRELVAEPLDRAVVHELGLLVAARVSGVSACASGCTRAEGEAYIVVVISVAIRIRAVVYMNVVERYIFCGGARESGHVHSQLSVAASADGYGTLCHWLMSGVRPM